jgi:hypothetical protein
MAINSNFKEISMIHFTPVGSILSALGGDASARGPSQATTRC